MPRRRIQRTPDEEIAFQELRRNRNAENQRRRRDMARNAEQATVFDETNAEHYRSSRPEMIVLEDSTVQAPLTTGFNTQAMTNTQRQQQYRARRRNIVNVDINFARQVIDLDEHYIGTMDTLCSNCGAKHFAAERISNKGNSFNDCCSHGEVSLEALPNPPPIFQDLFNGSHPQSNHFFSCIRSYNNSFSFASFNANLINFNHRRPGPYCFKIQGQIYYQINTALYPDSNENPSFGQLFIIDPNEAIETRCNENSRLDLSITRAIDAALRECNVFAQSYEMMRIELEHQQVSDNDIEPELQLLFTLKPGMNRSRYNFQRVNEVAAVFSTTADGEIPESYVTVRNKATKTLQYVSTMDPNVEPWIYPLFYPYGTRGWHSDLTCVNKNRRVTRAAYIKYRLAVRNDFNVFLMGRRLFQQWLVDSYVKIEKDRINYCKNHQTQLRAESYQGLIDHLQRRATDANSHVGKMIILPSTFIGSPRNMLQLYQDAMAIVRKFGKPDLFITMTCNPKWREIEENLLPGQSACDRPDIVARVFNIKKDYLINLIVKQKCFGEVLAFVYVIEFQKRGLPHIHMLITLKANSKISTAEIVNRYISAEIPDVDENPILHDIVMKNMIHGPCGDWCLVDNKCSKHYPKEFRNETTLDQNGYPSYRRRDTGKTFERSRTFIVDNRNVVPHSPMLLRLLNCHINVEVVSSIRSVKYLYKYIYKGHDAAAVTITETTAIEHDEINDYLETRYVGPVEASWRILSKSLQDKSHSIMRLPVHLPNQQSIIIQDDGNESEIRNALDKQTMLIDYFSLNARDPQAKQYLYGDIPTNYVFKKEPGTNVFHWYQRKSKFNVIGRMYSISPTQTELFHLRLLLLTVKGATSFQDLRTVDGNVQDTYASACLALGLIYDDDEWKRAMHEAEVWMMPRQLRCLFVRLLIHCHPLHPNELWEEFKDAMSQDYARYIGTFQAHRKAYHQIAGMLSMEGSDLAMFPDMEQIPESPESTETDDEILPQQARELGVHQYGKLNQKQKEVVDLIVNKVLNDNGNQTTNCFYIDGPGGSGKTFIYTTLCYLLKSNQKKVCTMAFTGIAATLLPNGKTVHKTLSLPVPLFADSVSNIKVGSKQSDYLKNVDVFIWDEAPMAPKYALDILDRTLRDILQNNEPFGGKIVVLGGDFRQLLPVQVRATRSELISLSIKFSPLWKHFSKFSLIENMRALPAESDFAKFLLDVGDGILNDENDDLIIPQRCMVPIGTDIVQNTYANLINEKRFDELSASAILSARNLDVEAINKQVVELLDISTERIYTSADSIENCDNGEIGEAILPEYLNTLNPPNFPPYELRLRVHCVIMLIRNLSLNEGLCNGTRLMVFELANNLLKCKILTGDKAGQVVFINRITLYCENIFPFTFKRRQFPVKLAFAMTINKAQGQTFSNIAIDLRKDIFNHGQLYVAFSRVRCWEALQVYVGDQRQNNVVKNYVYKELYL